MVTLGAVLVLGEKIGRRRMMGIVAAFIGAMLIIKLGTSVMTTMSYFLYWERCALRYTPLPHSFFVVMALGQPYFCRFFWYVFFIGSGTIFLADHCLEKTPRGRSVGSLCNIRPSFDDPCLCCCSRQQDPPVWLR